MYVRLLRPGTFCLVRPRVFRSLEPFGFDFFLLNRRPNGLPRLARLFKRGLRSCGFGRSDVGRLGQNFV